MPISRVSQVASHQSLLNFQQTSLILASAMVGSSSKAASPPARATQLPRLLGQLGRSNAGSGQKATPQKPYKDEDEGAGNKAPISMLQEFVQCCREFRIPSRRPILTWSFDTRMTTTSTLEFRATVAFVLAGIPHHSAGDWQLSKKNAQRDAAERALGFFVRRWGEQLVDPVEIQAGVSNASEEDVARIDFDALSQACKSFQESHDSPPKWEITEEKGLFQALLVVEILGVLHKFCGQRCSSQEEARRQTARRVLWYLQHPGYEDSFELDASLVAEASMAAPPAHWASDASECEALQVAERKTAVMRVQNRLQQALADQLKPGQSVWEWTYESQQQDDVWPPACRATVQIPAFGITLAGDWVRGHRAAQLATCVHVEHMLDRQT